MTNIDVEIDAQHRAAQGPRPTTLRSPLAWGFVGCVEDQPQL